MNKWTVEKNTNKYADYGETFFSVFADSYKEAWKEALKLEDKKDIKRIYYAKRIY